MDMKVDKTDWPFSICSSPDKFFRNLSQPILAIRNRYMGPMTMMQLEIQSYKRYM